jgi:four helix bundle protein
LRLNRPEEKEPRSKRTGAFKCGMRSSDCGMESQNLPQMGNADCRMRNGKRQKFHNAEFKMTTNESNKNRIERDLDQNSLKERTKRFALEIIQLVEKLPKGRKADILGRQLLAAGTSAGANYRAACRARSSPDFISKMGIVEEETDESIYWMELLMNCGLIRKDQTSDLLNEANEILAMTVSSIRTARRNK